MCGRFFRREEMTFSPRGKFCPTCDRERFFRPEPKSAKEKKPKEEKLVCRECGKELKGKAFGFFGDDGMKFFCRDGNYCPECFAKRCPGERKALFSERGFKK